MKDNLKDLADSLQHKQTAAQLTEKRKSLMSSVKVLADVVVKCSKEKENSENTRELEDEVDDYIQAEKLGWKVCYHL